MFPTNLLTDLTAWQRLPRTQPNTPAPHLPAVGSTYSLNNGNIKGAVAVIDGERVHYEERVKLFGGSQELTLTDRQGNRLSYFLQQHHWVNTEA